MYTFHKFGKDYSVLKREAINHYNQGLKCKQIATLMNIDRRTVGKWLKEEGFTYSRHNKANIDSSVFDTIDTSEKAYWLGFIFADGYVSKKNNFELSLAIKDLNHLTKLKEFIKFEGKIYIDNKIGRCRLQFQDSQIVNSLKEIGCINKKSLVLKFPDIDESLYAHFIRGYFDGDGCISDPKNSIAISIVGTKDFLEVIHHILDIPKYKIKHRQPLHSIEVNISEFSGEDARRFCLFVYNNSTIHLERKHERFIKHLEKHEYRIKKSKTTRVGTKVD
jgi:DNA-binding transcriptional regulator WhiA